MEGAAAVDDSAVEGVGFSGAFEELPKGHNDNDLCCKFVEDAVRGEYCEEWDKEDENGDLGLECGCDEVGRRKDDLEREIYRQALSGTLETF